MLSAQISQQLFSSFKKISSLLGSVCKSKHARKNHDLYVEKGLCEEAALDLNRFLATHGKGLLTLTAYFLAAALEGRQKLQLSQALWGELLGVEARNASRILSKAVAYGFIIKIRHPGGRTTYILKDIFLTQSVLLSLQWLLQTVDSSRLDTVIHKGETTIIYMSNIKRVYLHGECLTPKKVGTQSKKGERFCKETYVEEPSTFHTPVYMSPNQPMPCFFIKKQASKLLHSQKGQQTQRSISCFFRNIAVCLGCSPRDFHEDMTIIRKANFIRHGLQNSLAYEDAFG